MAGRRGFAMVSEPTGQPLRPNGDNSAGSDARPAKVKTEAMTHASARADEGSRLAREYRAGQRAAFAALVDLYQERLYRLAWRICGSSDEALDVVQDAFLRVADGIDRWDERSSFYSWLYRVTSNLAIDQLRRRARSQKALKKRLLLNEQWARMRPGEDDQPFGVEEKQHLLQRLRASVEELPPAQRAIVVLRHYDGLSLKEIAEVRGVALGTVKSSLFQAFQSLSRALGGDPAGSRGRASTSQDVGREERK